MGRTKALLVGMGAKGEAYKRFFHPKAEREKLWPTMEKKERATNVEVVGKGPQRIGRDTKICYECRIPEAVPDTKFYIVCAHFSVKVAPETPFEDEVRARAPAPAVGGAEGSGGTTKNGPCEHRFKTRRT